MGFISSALNQPEQWRVWSNMGLEFILAEPGSEARIFWDNAKLSSQAQQSSQPKKIEAGQAPQAAQTRPTASASSQAPAQTPGQASGQAYGRAIQAAGQYGQARALTQAGTTAEHSSKQTEKQAQTQAPSPNRALGQTAALPPARHAPLALLENLPEPWPMFAAKSKPGCPLLWTYQELGLDLLGRGAPARSNIIKKIIATLKLPAGSSNFWPHSVPEQTPQGQEFKQELHFFEQGFNILDPQFLLIFGKPSLEAIIPGTNCLPLSYTNYENKVLIYLPCLQELEDSQKLTKSVEFLQIFTLPCFGGGS